MSELRRTVTSILLATGTTYGHLLAQLTPSPQPEMAWMGDKVVLSDGRSFRILNPGKGGSTTLPTPVDTVDSRFAQDAFWVVQEDKPSGTMRISRSKEGRRWELVATWSVPEENQLKGERYRFYAHPIGEDRFVLVARQLPGFKVGKSYHPVVIAKVNDRMELHVAHAVDLGLREPLFLKSSRPMEEWGFNRRYIWVLSMLITPPFLTVGDQVFLKFNRIGTYMEVRPSGSIGKTFRVIPGLDEEAASDPNGYDWAVFCAQPNQDGEILVAARPADAVLEGRKRIPRTYDTRTMMDPARREILEGADWLAFKANPFIDWWTLSPSSGKIQRCVPPMNVPDHLETIEEFRRFVFHFDPAGNLVFPMQKKRQLLP